MLLAVFGWCVFGAFAATADDPVPPTEPLKLIFIHHSCGENWLSDEDGGLGIALRDNGYFVSDTNYGWGPNSIGDRTDILNWTEWFTGPESATYTRALYGCSDTNSPYARKMRDPGGENRIVMFKSCFPNSNLEGKPSDSAARGDGLTVGNAKAIYNELLKYFGTRPDKLFVVLTAPPVQDPAHAANARALNTWLARDWLAGYRGGNVAVFDFYNVLTGPDSHHRVRGGRIEHVTGSGKNTLHYPTDGDDHPSPAGNMKATEEFVPLLNAYYNNWRKGFPSAPAPVRAVKAAPPRPTPRPTPAPPPQADKSAPQSAAGMPDGVIDDFEDGTEGWDVFADHEKDTRLTFTRDGAVSYSGSAALRIEYDVAPESWASCSLVYPAPRDWRGRKGLALYVRAEREGQPVVVTVYQGESPDDLSTFDFGTRTSGEAVSGWQRIDVSWDKLALPAWQGDSSTPFDPAHAMGMGLSFHAPPGGRNAGRLWVDDISFLSTVPPAHQ